jgi:hypothetical protein
MTDQVEGREDASNAVPLGQRLFDNPFLLLLAGIVVMVLFYTGWGLWEVMSLPQATLP